MNDKPKCNIKHYGYSTVCHNCGLRWGTNDQNPPKCKTEEPKAERKQTYADRLVAYVDRLDGYVEYDSAY